MNNQATTLEQENNVLFSINTHSCSSCGECARVCPQFIISQSESQQIPQEVREKTGLCMNCGQCTAVCPTGSFAHKNHCQGDFLDIQTQRFPHKEQLNELFKSRRSVRLFDSKPVEKELIQSILDDIRFAPTGQNTQSIVYHVINSRETFNTIYRITSDWMNQMIASNHPLSPRLERTLADFESGKDPILRHSPLLVIAESTTKTTFTGMQDVIIALSYLELAAITNNLGTCWAGGLSFLIPQNEQLQKALGIENPHCYGLMIGYPQVTYYKSPDRKKPQVIFK